MRGLPTLAIIAAVILALAPGARAQGKVAPPAAEAPILFKADELRQERELGLVVASGHVEIAAGERILRADTVSYNQRTNVLTATGNVALLEPSGDVLFADHVELSGDFKNGIIENIRVLLSDNARLAAVGGRRIGGVITEMRKAVYSPCRACAAKPGRPLMWQIKAQKVVHNRNTRTIEYTDAFLEFFGIPVAYTPYLSHPDPTVKRKSGFLTPRYGSDSSLGVLVEVPYYFDIAPDKDATFRPVFTGDEGPVLAGQYRQRFVDGRMELEASATRGSTDNGSTEARGHLFGDVKFDLDRTWRTGAEVQLTSDDTYLRRYKFDSADTLTNHLFVEGFRGRNYAVAQAYYWRGLRAQDSPGETPIVAPMIDYSFVGQPGRAGGRWDLDANLMVLTRTGGTDSRRLSLKTGWRLPHVARTGEVYDLYASLQTDAYWVDEVQRPGRAKGDVTSGVTGRIFPRIGLDWRFPFARTTGTVTQVFEPVAGIALSPNGGNPGRIPNEDSKDFEFDDTNLLSPNRFTGLDRVEGGQRIHYGLKLGVYGLGGGFSSAFIGQSFRLRKDATFAADSGLADHFSDLVGRVQIRPNAPLNLVYRFRLDKDDLSAQRNEVRVNVGPPAFNVSANYIFVDQGAGSGEFPTREEITAGVRSQITPNWSVAANTRRDLTSGGGTLSQGFNITYSCDCFTASLDFTRTFTQDRDVRPTDTIFIRLTFKNLGEVATGTQR